MKNSQQLRQLGLKITAPRIKILTILEQSKARHLSAEDVYNELLARGEEIGLATVYRVLTQFETAGLLIRHHFEGTQSVFEVNYGEHHDHLVCVKCHHIEEFTDQIIESRQMEIAKAAGFNMTDHTLTIYGVCSQCGGNKSAK